MQHFLKNLITGIGINDIIDILIVAFVIYKTFEFIKESRAEQLVKGVVALLVVALLANVLHFYTISWIMKEALAVGIIALIIVFQPELRRGLEHMGRSRILNTPGALDKTRAKEITDEFVEGIMDMSSTRTGALIVFERQTSLTDIAETGTVVNGDVSAQLLGNIFYEGSPLHDGALIVRGDKLYAAGCVLPLSDNKNIPKSLGTRHRAGIGITEKSDCLTIIVSEETGVITVVEDGVMTRFLDEKGVEKRLLDMYLGTQEETKGVKKFIGKIGGRGDV